MKMKLYVLGLLFSLSAQAAPVAKLGTGFSAPTVAGTANVYNPQFGDIVYDSSSAAFWGFDQTSTWQQLGGGGGSSTPAGVISAYGGTSDPAGYFICDGRELDRDDYATLFAAIGTAFGAGDGTDTFNIPDFRGRFLRGVSGATSNDPDKGNRDPMAAGGNEDNNVGSVQNDELKSHSHVQRYVAVSTANNPGVSGIPVSGSVSKAVDSTESTGGFESRPKNAYVNYIIKY